MKMSGSSQTGHHTHRESEYYGSPSPQRSISSLGARHLSDNTKEQSLIKSSYSFWNQTKSPNCGTVSVLVANDECWEL